MGGGSGALLNAAGKGSLPTVIKMTALDASPSPRRYNWAPKCFSQSVRAVPRFHSYIFSASFIFVIYACRITRKATYRSIPGGLSTWVSKLSSSAWVLRDAVSSKHSCSLSTGFFQSSEAFLS